MTANRFDLFPLSIGKLISKHELQELHFSLTKGIWRHQRWGYPIRDAAPNAQLWLWFQHFHKKLKQLTFNLIENLLQLNILVQPKRGKT